MVRSLLHRTLSRLEEVLSGSGPISVDDGGVRADHVTITVGADSVEVPVPPA